MKKIFLILSTTLLTLTAQTFNVSTTPEFRTALQNAAMNGEDDTIILADGTYTTTDDGQGTFEYLDNEVYNLKLIGSSSQNVILSGNEQDQIFNHQSVSGANLSLEKLTFLDGGQDIEERTIVGGGFYTDKADVNISDCNFTNNRAKSGGGFRAFYGVSVNIINTTFSNNSAYGDSSVAGGGFYAGSAKVSIGNSTFVNNSAFGIGYYETARGGGFISNEAVINNSTFINNSTDGIGGGFYVYRVKVTNSYVNENSAYSYNSITDSYLGTGGGFYAHTNATIENSTFHKNIAGYDSGGFYAGFYDSSVIIDSTVTENIVYSPRGTGCAGFFAQSSIVISDSIIKDNYSESHGGGVCVDTGMIVNSIISNNYAEKSGGAIYAKRLSMSNSIIGGNSSGIALSLGTIEDPAIIVNNVFLDINDSIIEPRDSENDDPIASIKNNYIDLYYVDIRNFASNNIYNGVNLGFVDAANGDYHLTPDSDLIDTGTDYFADQFIVDGVNYLAKDYDGNDRISGETIDIGIYEVQAPTVNPALILYLLN